MLSSKHIELHKTHDTVYPNFFFEEAVITHTPPLTAYAHRYVDDDTAQDLTQEVFLKLYAQSQKDAFAYTNQEALFGWLKTVLKHMALNEKRRRQLVSFEAIQEVSLPIHSYDLPETIAVRTTLSQLLVDAMNQLPPKQRLVIFLQYYKDVSLADIAAYLDTTINTVKAWRRRALRRLHILLLDSFAEHEDFLFWVRSSDIFPHVPSQRTPTGP